MRAGANIFLSWKNDWSWYLLMYHMHHKDDKNLFSPAKCWDPHIFIRLTGDNLSPWVDLQV